MDRHRTQGSAEAVDIARNVHDALRFRLHSLGQWRAIGDKASSLAPLVSTLALAIGIALGFASDRLSSSPSEKHGWRVFGGMMGPVQYRGVVDEQNLASLRTRPAVAVASGVAGVAA